MFIKWENDLNHDITFCLAKDCPVKECGRHPSHYPKGVRYISIADFEPVCHTYIAMVVDDIERNGYNDINKNVKTSFDPTYGFNGKG